MLQTSLFKRTICAAMVLTLLCGGTLAHAEDSYQTEDATETTAEETAQSTSQAEDATETTAEETAQSTSQTEDTADSAAEEEVIADVTEEFKETSVSKTVTATSALNVRKGPGTSYSVIGSLKKNGKAEVVAESGSWYKIKYGSGYGYISKKYTKDATESSETTVSKTVTATSALNVRKGPGTSYSVIGSLKKNGKAEVVAESGSWYKIKYGSGYGYISKKYTKDA